MPTSSVTQLSNDLTERPCRCVLSCAAPSTSASRPVRWARRVRVRAHRLFLAADEHHSLDIAFALAAAGVCADVIQSRGPVAGARLI